MRIVAVSGIDYGVVLASLMIVIDILASLAYFIQKDIRHGIYWFAAAILTAVVTF